MQTPQFEDKLLSHHSKFKVKNSIETFEEFWSCPITSLPMGDPVVTFDGHSFERKAIFEWLENNTTSPVTNLPLRSKDLIPNHTLRNVINKLNVQLGEYSINEESLVLEIQTLKEKVSHLESELVKQKQNNQKLNELILNLQRTKEIEKQQTEKQKYKMEQIARLDDDETSEIEQMIGFLRYSTDQLKKKFKMVFSEIFNNVKEMFKNRQDYAPGKIYNQTILFQACIQKKMIVRNIDEQSLKMAIDFALRQLVYENENKFKIQEDLAKRGIEYKIENFIKAVNGVILRILQHANPQDVVNILISIHNEQNKKTQKSTKIISLIMKCISRVAHSYTAQQQIQSEKVVEFLVSINQYFAINPPATPLEEFSLPIKEKPTPEENFLFSIKSIISQLGKILKSDIWEVYEKAMLQAKYQDSYIAPFIKSLNKKYIETSDLNKKGPGDNQELKKISDLLSKHQTFDTGIQDLKKFCQINSDFSPIQYFTSLGYDQKFIGIVINGLQGKQTKISTKDTKEGQQYAMSETSLGNPNAISRQQNIRQKIKKLKQKFEEFQPPQNQPQVYQEGSNTKNSIQQELKNERQERAVEIKMRIYEMKSRLNLSSK